MVANTCGDSIRSPLTGDYKESKLHLFGGGGVLNQLQHIVTKDHCAGGVGQVHADFKGRFVDHAGHSAIIDHVEQYITQAAQETDPSGIYQPL